MNNISINKKAKSFPKPSQLNKTIAIHRFQRINNEWNYEQPKIIRYKMNTLTTQIYHILETEFNIFYIILNFIFSASYS